MRALTLDDDELGECDGLPLPFPPSSPAALLRLLVRLELLDWRFRLPVLLPPPLPCPAFAPPGPALPLLLVPAEEAAFAFELLLLPSLSLLARSWYQHSHREPSSRDGVTCAAPRANQPWVDSRGAGSRNRATPAEEGAEGMEMASALSIAGLPAHVCATPDPPS